MKNGPPITESIIPTGITIGAKRVRPKVSANNIRNAPKTAEHGINLRKSFPTICRAMCGAARPTNPINPVNAITTEVMSADSTRMFLRIAAGLPPVEIAKSSPPSTSKGGTAAPNYSAVESYEATTVHSIAGASPSANHPAEYQRPSTIYGGAATPTGCNSLHLDTLTRGPSPRNLNEE